MSASAWLCAGVLVGIFALLVRGRAAPDFVFVGALTVLLLAGVVDARGAFAGFANAGVLTVGALYVVVTGLRETGAVQWLGGALLGHPHGLRRAQLRLTVPMAAISGFINNTPLVAMMIPVARDWSRRLGIPVSQFLLPLNYAAVLGGTCTLIGTSTNLVVDGLMRDAGMAPLSFFALAPIGLPIAVAGVAFMFIAGPWLLPNRGDALRPVHGSREYSTAMQVDPAGGLAGKTIQQAGLRRLSGLYLMEIERRGRIYTAVGPEEVLEADDRLVFVGLVESVVELHKLRGLKPATEQIFRLDGPRTERVLVEAVVSDRCALVGRSIREGHFRTRYDAVVVAVARSGERLRQKLGDIVLRVGDTLLLEARPEFVERQRGAPDFFLVSAVDDSTPPRHERAWVALLVLAGMIVLAVSGILSMLLASFTAAAAMLLTRCVGAEAARRGIDWSVLVMIAAAIGLGAAVDQSGLAHALAHGLIGVFGESPLATLAAVYFTTAILTQLVSNNAAATLVFPLALALAQQTGAAPLPLAIGIILGASASFATPVAYQTNLMVYGAGGYRMGDYLKLGLPLNAIAAVLALVLIPYVFPLTA